VILGIKLENSFEEERGNDLTPPFIGRVACGATGTMGIVAL